jgi:hypothetical protein
MAIKVYSGVDGIPAPTFEPGQDWDEHDAAEKAYVDKLIGWAKTQSNHKYAGKIVRFPQADGYAQYLVVKPSALIHLAVGDAWHYPHVDRLLAKDIVAEVERQERLAKLFSNPELESKITV